MTALLETIADIAGMIPGVGGKVEEIRRHVAAAGQVPDIELPGVALAKDLPAFLDMFRVGVAGQGQPIAQPVGVR